LAYDQKIEAFVDEEIHIETFYKHKKHHFEGPPPKPKKQSLEDEFEYEEMPPFDYPMAQLPVLRTIIDGKEVVFD